VNRLGDLTDARRGGRIDDGQALAPVGGACRPLADVGRGGGGKRNGELPPEEDKGQAMSAVDVSEKRSLFEDLGGAPAIGAVVDEFYARVLADATLAPMFDGIDVQQLRWHQVKFFMFALGGPNEYRGRSLREAHAGMNITEAQFGAVAGHLSAALAACGVPGPMIETVIGQVAQLQGDVVGV
jgi:hemoglobin